jgi:hypothetical protein
MIIWLLASLIFDSMQSFKNKLKRMKRAWQTAAKGNVYRFASSMSRVKAIQRDTFQLIDIQ